MIRKVRVDEGYTFIFEAESETLIDAVGFHCNAGAAKKTWIANNNDTLVCAYAPEDAATARIDVEGRRVTGSFNFDTSNLGERFRAALLRSL